DNIVMVVVWNVVLERINKVNVQILPASTVDLITVADLYESLQQYPKDIVKRQLKRKNKYDEEMKITATDTFLVIIDRLVSELEKEQKAYNNFIEFSFLNKISELSSSTLTKKAVALEEIYSIDLETGLV
ncbi:hypothetical protein WA026_022287, partial [Henosepilachna vigintioctopunctata]